MIAEIIPFVRLPKSLSYFDYKVPQTLEEQIKIGQLVKIPFKGRNIKGLVIKIKPKPEIKKIPEQIFEILDLKPQINSSRLKLIWWIANYYLVSPSLVIKSFIPEPPFFIRKFKTKSALYSASLSIPKSDIPRFQNDLKIFFKSKKNYFLLHYNNQKYKIAIYLKIVEKFLKENKQILILEPQISDINFLLPYFLYLFPNQISILHGEQSKTEYWQEWKKILDGKAKIVIGTRSALFSPLDNLGLIIIDNEEMPDFKQSDQKLRYDARKIALELAKFMKTKVIFSSQAPRIETYYGVKTKKFELLANSFKTENHPQESTIIDMRHEIKKGNTSCLSDELQKNIQLNLEKKRKVVLLLNRKGTSTLIVCRDCGYVFKCVNCELPLVCHRINSFCSELICHHCNYKEPTPLVCPNCRSTLIKFLGVGTERVEYEIKKLFPNAKIIRIDKDVKINPKLQIHNYDIFVGTQFFIKNYLLKLKNVGLINVVSADTLLFRPDFRSEEKNFEWLAKIININRQFKSSLLIQTFFPENSSIKLSIAKNYNLFYNYEIEERKKFFYPPFGKLIKLTFQHINEKKCIFETTSLFKNLVISFGEKLEIFKDEKPKKTRKKFISAIVLKFPIFLHNDILTFLKSTPDGWTIDVDPESLL